MADRESTERRIRSWVEAYVTAWTSNEPADIRALFTDDGEYRTEPWVTPTIGIDAIVAQWIEIADLAGSWEFEWDIAGMDGARAFVEGVTRYADGRVYNNLWIIDLAADGRATSFTEWWMKQTPES